MLIVECAFEHEEFLAAQMRVVLNSGTGIELHQPDRLRFMFMKMYTLNPGKPRGFQSAVAVLIEKCRSSVCSN